MTASQRRWFTAEKPYKHACLDKGGGDSQYNRCFQAIWAASTVLIIRTPFIDLYESPPLFSGKSIIQSPCIPLTGSMASVSPPSHPIILFPKGNISWHWSSSTSSSPFLWSSAEPYHPESYRELRHGLPQNRNTSEYIQVSFRNLRWTFRGWSLNPLKVSSRAVGMETRETAGHMYSSLPCAGFLFG